MTESRSPAGYHRALLFTSFGSVASLVLLFAEMLIVVRLVPTDTFGSYVLLITLANLMVMATDFGCKLAVTHFISSADRARQEAVVGSVLIFRAAVMIGVTALILLLQGLLDVLHPSANLGQYLHYLPLMIAVCSFDELLLSMLQGFHAYRPMAVAQVARGMLRIVLTVVLLIALNDDIAALIASWSISFALLVVYEYWALPVRKVRIWRWATCLEILRFGFPLQMTRFLGFTSERLHLALLAAFTGANGVAFFAIAKRVPEALQTLTDSYFRVYFPTMTRLLAAGQRHAAELMLQRSLRLISFSSALAAIAATVFSREIVSILFSEKYAASASSFAVLMIALHMTVLVSVLGYTLTAAGRPGRSLRIDVVRAAVSIAGALALIPALGIVGAGYAILLGSYASAPIAAVLVRRSQLIASATPHIKQTLILLICAAAGWWIHLPGSTAGLAFKTAILVLFVFMSLLASTISRDDLALILGQRAPRRAGALDRPPTPQHVGEIGG